jgi:alkylation response protein AidB-like acyl-CoA dehydrogenase
VVVDLLDPAMTDSDLRQQVRNFIDRSAPSGHWYDGIRVPRDAETERAVRAWYAELFSAGLMGGSWPLQYGGREDHTPYLDAVVMEEIVRARAPRPIDQVLLAAHLIIEFGTDEQRGRYLPRIRSAEDIWCQLLSEPGVGSDLARLTTKAVELPDGSFRVDGQKVWTTDAQWSQMGVLLARTDPTTSRPHSGLTMFTVDMSSPGVDIRPIREMTGSDEFCEVYLDGVIVPSDQILGQVNQGWAVANSGLASERAYVGANAVMLQLLFDDLVELARHVELPGGSAINDPVVREALADFNARVAGVQLIARRAVDRVAGGTDKPTDGMIAKLAYTELNVAICMYAVNLEASGRLNAGGADVSARWRQAFLWSRALTISGGSSEIVRNVLATQLFGFPRSW